MRTLSFSRLWLSLYEPRAVTALTMMVYAVTFILGMYVIMHGTTPPAPYDRVLRLFAGAFLASGGAVGLPTARVGARWLERSAALSVAGGFVVMGLYVLAVETRTDLVMPATTISGAVVAALFALARFFYIRGAPYAPGKGPLSAEMKARVQEIANDE